MAEMVMTNGGLTVTCNGVTAHKPEHMSEAHWFGYEAPRIGKAYGKHEHKYGASFDIPTHGVEERGEGCDGGACAI